jgi:hypothetical protein
VEGNINSRTDAGKRSGKQEMDRMVNEGNVKVCTKINYSRN